MKTPYDGVLRLRQRAIDDMRVLINIEVNQMIVLDQQRDAIEEQVRAEQALASRHHDCSAYAFAMRMRTQRDALTREREASDGRLAALREQAIEAYGSLGAIAAAADRHRAEANRTAAIAEQGQLDDFSAARFTLASQAMRRARIEQADEA